MLRFDAALFAPVLAASLAACAGPTTQLAAVAPEGVRSEQLKQQQLVIESDLRQQQRVEDVGQALLAAATPFCGTALAPRVGVRFANLHSFPREYQEAARSLGFTDTLVIVGVAQGSTAARSGFSLGDRVVALDGGPAPRGPNAVSLLARAYAPRLTLEQGDTRFLADVSSDDPPARVAARAGGQLQVVMPADTVCGFNLAAVRREELNAWADGVNVTVTSAMLRFVADDDELAAVLAHEIAHNVMRHVQAQPTTGAIIDSAAAIRGANAQGELTKLGANVGSTVFSQDFEREADYVGMYLLARAGRPIARVPSLWRRMAQENPGSKYASSHPTTADRFVRLEQVAGEIEQKIARREDLRPEMGGASPPTRNTVAETPPTTPPTRAPVKRASSNTSTVLVDRPQRPGAPVEVDKFHSPPTRISSAGEAPLSTTTIIRSDSVSYTFGPPAPRDGMSLAQVRRRAREAFEDGREALDHRLYEWAENRFREAVLYDGSEARYHAALGTILLKRGKRVEAEAVLTAAVLLDIENADYRQLLIDARQRP